MLNEFLNTVKARINPNISILGILIARWENVNLSKDIESRLRSELGDIVFKTKIRKNIKLATAPLERKDILTFSPESNGAKDYMTLTEEILTRLK